MNNWETLAISALIKLQEFCEIFIDKNAINFNSNPPQQQQNKQENRKSILKRSQITCSKNTKMYVGNYFQDHTTKPNKNLLY